MNAFDDSRIEQMQAHNAQRFAKMFGDVGQTRTFLARLGDGAGNIAVPPELMIEPGEVYCHIPSRDGGGRRVVFTAVNKAGAGLDGQWVVIGRAPGSSHPVILDVVASRAGQYRAPDTQNGIGVAQIEPHAGSHHVSGDDGVLIDAKQLISLGLAPYWDEGASGGLRLQVTRGFYRWGRQIYYLASGKTTADLSAYQPPGPNQAVWVMVLMDPETQALSYQAGDPFAFDPLLLGHAAYLDLGQYAPQEVPAGQHVVGFALLPDSLEAFEWAHVEAHVGLTAVVDGAGVSSLADLDDVLLTAPVDDDVLAYDEAAGKFVNKTMSGSGGASSFDDLTDTEFTGLDDGDIAVYHLAEGKWQNQPIPPATLADQEDTALDAPADGDAVVFQSASGLWENVPMPTTLDALDDTSLLNLADDQVVAYDAGTGLWKNRAVGDLVSGSALAIAAFDWTTPPFQNEYPLKTYFDSPLSLPPSAILLGAAVKTPDGVVIYEDADLLRVQFRGGLSDVIYDDDGDFQGPAQVRRAWTGKKTPDGSVWSGVRVTTAGGSAELEYGQVQVVVYYLEIEAI